MKFKFRDKNILTWVSIISGFVSIILLCYCGIIIMPSGKLCFDVAPMLLFILILVMLSIWVYSFLLYKTFSLERKFYELDAAISYLKEHSDITDEQLEHILEYSKNTRKMFFKSRKSNKKVEE